jgi:uncharacterized membrane protein
MDKPNLQQHLRNTFLAGIFAAVPIAGTAFVIWYVDAKTRIIAEKLFGVSVPFLGVLVAVAAIYIVGVIATSLLGRFFLRQLDKLLARIPGFKELYAAWKQISLTSDGAEGVFSRVALVSDDAGFTQIGFTNGREIAGDAGMLLVFVPNAPNPINGRMYLVKREKCRLLDLSAEEAFKMILSTGNYIPTALCSAASKHHP